ncbi:phosphoprotein phosphatase [Schizosaccharomyces japonicus yFS275]|uniref:Phosphoprotein phosphatase n=1 Tax=Schizosaccharomyces japonicus (strain yFS275 / FY16936) TaxID=402676 RepID=B6K2Y4_SCHJY|nr:phosphoprotein phosphatase [Schizosaccharomyces japonicus yFS275]EEB07841.1 phosphoprotein phosphatase [Schizosaccharomyces japonicus yFS275]
MPISVKSVVSKLLAFAGLVSTTTSRELEKRDTDIDWLNYQSEEAYKQSELITPLEWGQLNFIHTTDTHGWLEGHATDDRYKANFGEFKSFVQRMKDIAARKNVDLIVIDTGDLHDGTGFSDLTTPDGIYTDEIFKNLPFDVLTIGNHELYNSDVSKYTYSSFVPHWNGRYLTSNVDIFDPNTGKQVPFGKRSYYFTTSHGVRIMAFGFLFNFRGHSSATVVTPVEDAIKTDWFQNDIHRNDVDLFLVLGHIPVRNWDEWRKLHAAIRAAQPNTPIQMFGGHSHDRDFTVFDDSATALESGRYCETVGWLSIDGLVASSAPVQHTGSKVSGVQSVQAYANLPHPNVALSYSRRYMDFNRGAFVFHTGTTDATFDTSDGSNLSQQIMSYRQQLDMSEPFGCNPQNYYMTEVPHDSKYSLFRFFNEEVFPDIVKNERGDLPRVIFSSGGAFRANFYKGEFNKDTMFQVSPYNTDYFNYLPDVPYSYVRYAYEKLNGGNKLRDDEAKYHKVPGYTTYDDLGGNGDDTLHSNVPYYTAPNLMFQEVNIDTNDEPETVDVIALNYLQKKLTAAINEAAGKQLYKTGDWLQYFVREDHRDSLTDILPLYAEKHWPKHCSN